MNEDMLIERILNQTKDGKLEWTRNDRPNATIFNCRLPIDEKKKLILKGYLANRVNGSYFEVKMNNGVRVLKMDLDVFPSICDILYTLDFKVKK